MKEESRRNVLNQLSSTGNGQKRREGCRDTGALVLCANNLSRGPSSIAFVFPAQARSVPPPPSQICSKISGLEAKFVPYFHVCPYFALMRPRPLSLRRPIFEASHFCPTASTSSSPGRFGGCERGERVREWTGARWHGGQESRDAPHYHASPTWNPYIILRILATGRRRARARERGAELSLTISSFGLSEKFAGRRERSTAESVPDGNGNRQPTDRQTGVRHTLELRRRRKGPRRARRARDTLGVLPSSASWRGESAHPRSRSATRARPAPA